jgi:(p)ppGpp synthase/HD superfamily hydrolase
MPTIEETQAWVRKLHRGQTDKAGQPYVEHVLRVHERLLSLFPDASIDAEHAALLHDAIEDCGVNADDLRRRGYTEKTIRIVEAVTKPPDGGQTYAERVDHLARSRLIGALQVKIADLSDNSDAERLAMLPQKQGESLAKRYRSAIGVLRAALTDNQLS